MKLPIIGGRIIKTALAILICLLLSLLHHNEFVLILSCVSAVLCIQQDVKHALNFALTQAFGIFYACILGFGLILIKNWLDLTIYYVILSLCIILLIYGLVVVRCAKATHLACFTLLFITLGNAQFWQFLIYFVGALEGVFVASAINLFHLPYHKQNDILFVCGLEHCLLLDDGTISDYSKLQLKELLDKDANIVLTTSKSVGSIYTTIQDFDLKFPIVSLNGAASYDLNKQEYIHINYMNKQSLKKYYDLLNKYQLNCFIHTIHYDMLHIYYQNLDDEIVENYYHQKRKTPYDHYIHLNEQVIDDVVSIVVVAEKNKVNHFIHEMKESGIYYEFNVALKAYEKDYVILEISDLKASKKKVIEEIYEQSGLKRLYVFASQIQDIELMGYADKSFVCRNGLKSLFEYGEKILGNHENGVVIKLKQLFYHKKG